MKMNKIDIFLASIFALTIVFISVMVWLFYKYQSVPDSLVAGFFGFVGGECGVLGWIKSSKERRRERQYQIEDRDHEEQVVIKNNNKKEDENHENTDVCG